VLSLGAGDETTRFHQGNCWLGSGVAACRARATNVDAGDRVSSPRFARAERTSRGSFARADEVIE